MLATWVAFGWPRLAFPSDSVTPGDAVTPAVATSEYGRNSAPPLRLKLARAIGASRTVAAAASKKAVVARDEETQPLRLKLADTVSALPAVAETTAEPVKATISVQGEEAQDGKAQDEKPRLQPLKLAEAIGVSSAAAPAGATPVAQREDTRPLRLRLAQELGALPAVATIAAPPVKAAAIPAGSTAPPAGTATPGSATPGAATPGAATPGAATPRAATPEEKPVSRLQFAPVEYGIGGDFGYNVQHQTIGAEKSTSQFLSANVRAVANTFIWQPWFAQVKGGLGLGFSQSSASSTKSSSDSVTGDGALNLLPSSRFPFNAHFSKGNNNQNVDMGTGSSFQTTNYGLSQRYRPRSGDAQYMVSYDRNLWKSTNYDDKQDQLKFDSTHQFRNSQTLNVNGDATRNTRSNTSDTTLTKMLTANHNYRPDSVFSVETLANLIETNYSLSGGETTLSYKQLSSSAFWRPANKPLTVNGAVRVYGLDSESSLNSAGSSNTRTVNANVGANYELSKHIRLNGSGNVNVTETGGSQMISTNENIGATYQPDAIAFGKYSYTRSISSGLSNSSSDAGSEQHFTLNPAHGLNRSLDFAGGKLTTSLHQTAAADVGSQSPSTMSLSHSGSLGWSVSQGQKNTMLRLSASDSRAMVGDKYAFQLLNMQATLDEALNRYASWNGNLTIQVVRQETGTAETTTTTTAGADLSYRHQRVFNIPRLRFTSDLRVTGDALIPVLATPGQQDSVSWDNRLDYSIGRTQIRLSARVAEVNKVMQSLIWFSLTRQF